MPRAGSYSRSRRYELLQLRVELAEFGLAMAGRQRHSDPGGAASLLHRAGPASRGADRAAHRGAHRALRSWRLHRGQPGQCLAGHSHAGPADPDGQAARLLVPDVAHPAGGAGHSAHPVNAFEGVASVDRDLKDAARGMGMTDQQILRKVEIPVALPLIMLGLRTAAIFVVATATIAAVIGFGVGGLGRYILDGLATNNYGEVAGGAALVVVLALLVQFAFVGLRRLVVPAPLRDLARADS